MGNTLCMRELPYRVGLRNTPAPFPIINQELSILVPKHHVYGTSQTQLSEQKNRILLFTMISLETSRLGPDQHTVNGTLTNTQSCSKTKLKLMKDC